MVTEWGARMKAKEYLGNLRALKTKLDQKKAQLLELAMTRGNIGSFDYSKERVQASTDGNQVENDAIKLLMLESSIKDDIIDFEFEKDKIIREIHSMKNPEHITLLFKRYVEFKRFEVIAIEMNFTYQYTRELHGNALQDFETTYTNLQNNVL